MDYDEERIYYSYQNLQTDRERDGGGPSTGENEDMDKDDVNLQAVKRHFREFLRK